MKIIVLLLVVFLSCEVLGQSVEGKAPRLDAGYWFGLKVGKVSGINIKEGLATQFGASLMYQRDAYMIGLRGTHASDRIPQRNPEIDYANNNEIGLAIGYSFYQKRKFQIALLAAASYTTREEQVTFVDHIDSKLYRGFSCPVELIGSLTLSSFFGFAAGGFFTPSTLKTNGGWFIEFRFGDMISRYD